MILILGCNGQLGTELAKQLGESIGLSKSAGFDIVSSLSDLDKYKFDCVVNCAAYTNVDSCEVDPISIDVNGYALKSLSEYCNTNNIPIIHISTDYVFGQEKNRSKPYNISDLTGPVNAYGISKLMGECYLSAYSNRYSIIRTCGLYGQHGNNFVKTMIGLKDQKQISVIDDQICTPTNVENLCKVIIDIYQNKLYNNSVFHCTNEGECSWYEFALHIFKTLNVNIEILPIKTDETFLAKRANRPLYSVLENYYFSDKIMPHWKESLDIFVKTIYGD